MRRGDIQQRADDVGAGAGHRVLVFLPQGLGALALRKGRKGCAPPGKQFPGEVQPYGPVVTVIVAIAPAVVILVAVHVVIGGVHPGQKAAHGGIHILVGHFHGLARHHEIRPVQHGAFNGRLLRNVHPAAEIAKAAHITHGALGRKAQVSVKLHFRIADIVAHADHLLLCAGKFRSVLQDIDIRGHAHPDKFLGGSELGLDTSHGLFRAFEILTAFQQLQKLQLHVAGQLQFGLLSARLLHFHGKAGFLQVVQMRKAGEKRKGGAQAPGSGAARVFVTAVGRAFRIVLKTVGAAHQRHTGPEVALRPAEARTAKAELDGRSSRHPFQMA